MPQKTTVANDSLTDIPNELATPPKWLQYYLSPGKPGKKPTKHPCVKYAADEHKANLRSLPHLMQRPPQAGFQRWVDKSEGFVFVDIDNCRDPETDSVQAFAQEIVDLLNSYTEISASGKGLHIVCRGTLPEDFHVDGNPVEVYAGNIPNKLIAMTGEILPLAPYTIEDRQNELSELLAKVKAKTGRADGAPQFSKKLVFTTMDKIEAKPIKWLWLNRIPLSAITLLTGNPDTGKTSTLCDIAARVSSFRNFPDVKDQHTFGGYVAWLSDEDSPDKVLKPRLMAAGADEQALKKIGLLKSVEIRQGAKLDERMFALDEDLKQLEEAIKERGDSLVIIDPVSSYFGKGNMNKTQDVRAVFSKIAALCESRRVAVIAVEHSNKRTDVAAIHKVGGSQALVAASRAAFVLAKLPDEEGQYVMHFVKGNLARRKTGLRFTIEGKEIAGIGEAPFIKWGAEDTGTADELLAAERGQSEDNRGKRAANFLREFLTEERPADDVMAEAKKKSISRDALYEVKKELGIKAVKRAGCWYWQPGADSVAF